MKKSSTIAITGATGYIGAHVAALLAEEGVSQRLIVRDPSRAPHLPHAEIAVAESYSDTQGMRDALQGIGTLLLVSGREAPNREHQHIAAIDAAVAAGVERIVYLSFLNAAPDATFTFARQHFFTEEHIRSTGVRYTFLRDATYLDFVPMLAGEDGVIRGPADEGRMAPVARDDIVTVAGTVLQSDDHDGQIYDLTGREELTMDECAAHLSRVTGRSITFHNETMEEAWASRAHYGAPEFEVEGWITTYVAIARGEMGPASDIIRQLTGKDALTLDEYLRLHPESYKHLLPSG